MHGLPKLRFVAVNSVDALSRLLRINGHISQERRQNGGFTSSSGLNPGQS